MASVDPAQQRLLVRYILLSLGAAVVTIALKLLAALLTGSVAFLSDAMESGVNLVAAVVALVALRAAARPADDDHHFGHGKAEYLSAAVEGGMIFVAAGAIVWAAVGRLIDPEPLEQTGLGLTLSTGAAIVNLAIGWAILQAGRRHRSMTLVADGRHLLTDVVTSAGVLLGVALVALTGEEILDPIVALLAGLNILWTGWQLIHRSVIGLLDAALPPEDAERIHEVIDAIRAEQPVDFHALRTRESGRQRFVYVHLLVPDEWTVKRGHDLAERVEDEVAAALPGAVTFVHLEPRDDPASYDHEGVDAGSVPPEISAGS